MKEFLTEMQNGLESMNTGGQYLAIFFCSLLFLYLIKPKENRTIRIYSLITAVFLFFPLTAFVIVRYRTGYYDYASLWSLLPVTVVAALGLTEAAELLQKKTVGKRWIRYAGYAGLAAAVALCGTLSPFHTDLEKSRGFEKTSLQETEVLECLAGQEEWEGLRIWAPDKIVEEARAYDGSLQLVYGRDMWNNALSGYTFDVYSESKKNLYAWMNINWIEVEAYSLEVDMTPRQAFDLAAECGCRLAVLTKEQAEIEQIRLFLDHPKQKKWKLAAETEGYVIYEFSDTL